MPASRPSKTARADLPAGADDTAETVLFDKVPAAADDMDAAVFMVARKDEMQQR